MGGSAQNTLQNCLGLADKYEMILMHGLSLESGMTESEKADVEGGIRKAANRGVRFYTIASLVRRIDPVADILTLWYTLRIIRKEKPTIVHTHSSKAGLIGRWAAWLAGAPIIVHTPHGHVFFGHFGPFASWLFRIIEKLTAPITDVMIALTEGERRDYQKYRVCRRNKIARIHSGVDIQKFTQAASDAEEISSFSEGLGLNIKAPIIGTVGWLLPIKGPMVLLEAMERVWTQYPEVQLVYVGKGDLLATLQTRVNRQGAADRVHFLGWRDDIPKVMSVF